MSFITDTTLFIILWLFTGLCGGTVCTINKKLKQSGKYDKAPITFSENAGCILGQLAAILVSVFFGTYSPDIMLVCGAISTLAAILCMIITMQKEKNMTASANSVHNNAVHIISHFKRNAHKLYPYNLCAYIFSLSVGKSRGERSGILYLWSFA